MEALKLNLVLKQGDRTLFANRTRHAARLEAIMKAYDESDKVTLLQYAQVAEEQLVRDLAAAVERTVVSQKAGIESPILI